MVLHAGLPSVVTWQNKTESCTKAENAQYLQQTVRPSAESIVHAYMHSSMMAISQNAQLAHACMRHLSLINSERHVHRRQRWTERKLRSSRARGICTRAKHLHRAFILWQLAHGGCPCPLLAGAVLATLELTKLTWCSSPACSLSSCACELADDLLTCCTDVATFCGYSTPR